MKSNYSFEIEKKKKLKIAIELEKINDVNSKFQPADMDDMIFEEAFNQIFKRNNNNYTI